MGEQGKDGAERGAGGATPEGKEPLQTRASTWVRGNWGWVIGGTLGGLLIIFLYEFFWAYLALRRFPDVGSHKDQIEALRNFITTVAGILGGAIAFGFVIWRQVLLHRQTNIAHQSHYTTLFTKAVEQLGATREEKEKNVVTDGEGRKTADSETVRTVANIEVRLGAIYALERIARENLDFHWQIMEILCAYIRENGRKPEPIPNNVRAALTKGSDGSVKDWELIRSWKDGLKPPRADVQAALTVIGRCGERQRAQESEDQHLDLRGAGLSKADLSGLRFDRAIFDGAHLEGARLFHAHLKGASLDEVHLEGAQLYRARLEGARLYAAHLEGASFDDAHLEGARLVFAHLEGARLEEAHLEGAHLEGAHLEGAAFRRAHVEGAELSEAIGLSQKQVDRMIGDNATMLPDGLTRPAHWK